MLHRASPCFHDSVAMAVVPQGGPGGPPAPAGCEVRAANPPKGFGLFACASCPAYSPLFTEDLLFQFFSDSFCRFVFQIFFSRDGIWDSIWDGHPQVSSREEPLFAIQHSGNRRVARSPKAFRRIEPLAEFAWKIWILMSTCPSFVVSHSFEYDKDGCVSFRFRFTANL